MLLCFVVDVDGNSAVFSKHKPTLEAKVLQAAVQAGGRLTRVSFGSADGVSGRCIATDASSRTRTMSPGT